MINPAGLLLIAVGLFSFAGGALDWDWFMNTRRARPLVKSLGRGRARAFYMLVGLGVSVFGVLIALGIVGGGR